MDSYEPQVIEALRRNGAAEDQLASGWFAFQQQIGIGRRNDLFPEEVALSLIASGKIVMTA